MIKGIFLEPTVNTIFNDERLNAFLLKTGNITMMSALTMLIQYSAGSSSWSET